MRMLQRKNSALAVLLSVALIGGVVATALTADGFRETRVELNDGGVWVTRPGQIGRLNTQIRSIEIAIGGSITVDVAQAGNTVVMLDEDKGEMQAVNAALAEKGDVRSIPKGSELALSELVGVLAEPSKGRIWVTAGTDIGLLDVKGTKPDLTLKGKEKASVVAAGEDGRGYVYQLGSQSVQVLAPGADPEEIGLDEVVAEPSITVVGDQVVLLDGRSSTLVVPGRGTVDLSEHGDGLRLQQAGPTRPEVLVGADEVLLAVPLGDADPRVLADGGAGGAIEPVWAEGCAYGAWGDTPRWARWCEGDAGVTEAERIPDDSLRNGSGLVYRVNHDRVVLNDRASDINLLVDLPVPEIVKDWDQALDKNKNEDDSRQEARQKEQAKCSETPPAPRTKDDIAGTRPDQPVIVPVLENDESDRCDVLTIAPFATDQLPANDVADVAVVSDGAALQVTPAPGRTAPIEIAYRAVGKGGETAATLTVNVSTDAENGAPEPTVDATVVESGQTVRHNVLVNDRDPDGDPLNLVSVLPGDDGSAPQFQANGVVTYTAPGGFVGTVILPYTVADDRDETAESELTIRVQAAGANLPPKARNDRLDAYVGKESKVDLLANDTDPNGDVLKVVEVDADESLGARWDPDGTFSVTPTAETLAWVRYEIADDDETAEAWVFVRVSATERNTPPIAVRDDLIARPSVPALVDLVANDLDADGDLLAVTSIEVPPASGLSVELLEMRVARVTASAAFQQPAVINYSITDGSAAASGRLVVRPYRLSGLDQPPITVDDTAAVRVGKATSIPVLRNDVDPEGEQLKIVAVEEVDSAQGQLFVQEDELRFKAAPGARRSVTASYTVEDPAKNTASGQVRIQIIPEDQANRPPQAPRLDARVFSGRSVAIRVPLVGLDPDGDPVQIVGVETSAPPAKGSVEVVADGFTYQADEGSAGADTFDFLVRDDLGLTSTGRVRVVIAPTPKVNTAPSAVPDRIRIAPGQTRPVDVLANDLDVDGDQLSLLTGEKDAPTQPPPGAGVVTVEGNRVVFEAPGSITGDVQEASFTYGVADGRGGSSRGVVTVTIDAGEPPNLPPIAVDDFVVPQLAGRSVTVPVLANDRDPDDPNATLRVDLLDSGAGEVLDDGSIRVELGRTSTSFVYRVTDASDDVAYALVTIPVAERLPPVAVLDELEMEAGEQEVIDVLENDLNPGGDQGDLEITKVINQRGGETTLRDGKVVFDAATDWRGDAGFSYIVSNGTDQALGAVRIRLTGQDFPPEFAGTTVELPAGGERDLDLQSLTTDPDTKEHDFSQLAGASGGIEASIDGSVLRVRAANDTRGAKATLTLQVADDKNQLDVEIPVLVSESVAPLPVAVDDAAETVQGEEVSVAATSNDVDPVGKGLRVLRVDVSGGASVGRAAPSGDGSVTFTPSDSFFGSALVTYTVGDDTEDADREVNGTIRITVYGRPSKPPTPSGTAESHLVRLTWGVPANNGAPITGYIVESDVGGFRASPGTNAATIEGLRNAQPYRFRVAALNRAAPDAGSVRPDQWSDWSPALTPDQFPDQPAAPIVEFRKGDNAGGSGGVLHVRWTPPTVDGTPITEYKVQPSGGAGRSFPPGTTSVAWTGLNNGTPYTFTVVAINKAGDSEPSPPSAQETPAGVPGAPANVTSQRVTDGRNDNGGLALVQWGAAGPNGDPTGTRYRVTAPGSAAGDTDQTSLERSGLNPNTSYAFTVVAFNKAGDGPGATASPVFPEGKPAPPAAPRFLPGSDTVEMTGVSSADTRGPGEITYQVSTSSGDAGFNNFNARSFGLSNGQTRSVWVRACKFGANSSGQPVGCGTSTQASNSSTGESTVTPFGNPAVSATHSGATITWTWVDQAGVSTYSIQGQSGGESCGRTCYSKSFALGQRHCIRVVGTGQGVQRTSTEVCEPTARLPQRSVSLSAGQRGNWPDCSTSPCRRVRVDLTNFAPGERTVVCWGSYQGWSRYYTYRTTSNSSEVCYFGYPGDQVYVVVDGVQSNTIIWPEG